MDTPRPNVFGIPVDRQLQYGSFGEALGPMIQWTLLVQRLQALGPEGQQVVNDAMAARTGKTPEEALEILEDLAEKFLPDSGDLFTYRGQYGVFFTGLSIGHG